MSDANFEDADEDTQPFQQHWLPEAVVSMVNEVDSAFPALSLASSQDASKHLPVAPLQAVSKRVVNPEPIPAPPQPSAAPTSSAAIITEAATSAAAAPAEGQSSEQVREPTPSNPFAPRETVCELLVVDSAGFLKHVALESMGKRIITIPQVIAEIRDKVARERLQNLPFEIEFREPSPESIQHETDLRVMALVRMLEVEQNGAEHIHTAPKPPPTPGSIKKPCRYGFDCTRPDCWFQHDSPGEVQPSADVPDPDDDWITPENYQEIAEHLTRITTSLDARAKVACLTSDFAMQNVLLQMGLRVVSVDGLLVRTVKCYALRIERRPERQFCFFCGNPSLIKVSMIIEGDGSVRYGIPKAMRITTRGTKFSIPKPKGGRSDNMILREDQKEYQRPQRKEKQFDVFSDDYVVQQSPFGMAKPVRGRPVIGVGKRNPNEAHRKKR